MGEERGRVERKDETQGSILLRLFFAQIRSKEGEEISSIQIQLG